LRVGYRPEDDVSPSLNQDDTTYYRELVGVLRWAIELGQIDNSCKVAMLTSHLALPCEGHLQQVLHSFGYLKQYPKKSIFFNPGCILVPPERFQKFDWADFYQDIHKEIPPYAPDPQGHTVHIFVLLMHIMQPTSRHVNHKRDFCVF
jgi:hypothetical protein